MPQDLVDQLAPGGKMVIPVGRQGFDGQDFMLVERDQEGKVTGKNLMGVRYVPLVKVPSGKAAKDEL